MRFEFEMSLVTSVATSVEPSGKIGLYVNLSVSPNLEGVDCAIGGGPALVIHGKSQHKEQPGKADHLRERNPRTAIGWNEREFFMVVVDGRKPNRER